MLTGQAAPSRNVIRNMPKLSYELTPYPHHYTPPPHTPPICIGMLGSTQAPDPKPQTLDPKKTLGSGVWGFVVWGLWVRGEGMRACMCRNGESTQTPDPKPQTQDPNSDVGLRGLGFRG
jgi:hypothetical protein